MVSVCGVLFEVVRAASVFARPRNNAVPEFEDGAEVAMAPCGNVVCDGDILDEVSELKDCDLEAMGTVKLLKLVSDTMVSDWPMTFVLGSSSGIASGAGTGFPLAAATNWFSVHESE